jgi:Ser/Thr protein kinase RdoA (MazF antagonist)
VVVTERLEGLLGAPVVLEELKHKPGRRRTLRAAGPRGRAIVKIYASDRAPAVAARLRVLAEGPPEPHLPRVLAVEPVAHTVVLSEVPGHPLREAVLNREAEACWSVGAVLARWHGFWRGRPVSPALPRHSITRELEILRSSSEGTSDRLRAAARSVIEALGDEEWPLDTVVHRDLYEEQILLGEGIGLIDLDDAAVGPAELDLGNLLAHIDLLARRRGLDLRPMQEALLEGYGRGGGEPNRALLARCRGLSLVRLACIHRLEDLLGRAGGANPLEMEVLAASDASLQGNA